MKLLVIMILSVEVLMGEKVVVFEVEFRLCDVFFFVLIEYVNIGGFDGNFISSVNMCFFWEVLFDVL